MQFTNGNSINYVYDAAGRKLSVTHRTAVAGITLPMTNVMTPLAPNNVAATTTTDYCGNIIYENGAVSKVLTEEGYITLPGTIPTYHYYLKDHQGNNRVVIDQYDSVKQVNHYYPFGGLFGDNMGGGVQPYKYNGKELDRMHGLDLFDYGARHYDAAIGRWGTVDPLAEKYYSVSPYAYVANNPVRFIDPTGMVIDSLSLEDWNSQKKDIASLRDELNSKNKKGKNNSRIASLNSTLDDMKVMENSETVYSINKVNGTGFLRYDSSTGNMILDYNGTANFVHEITHGGQFERGEIGYTITGGAIANDIWDEVAAYKAQSAFDPQSTGGRNIDQITPKWVRALSDERGVKIYAPGGEANIGGHSLNKNSGMYDMLQAYPRQQKAIIQSFGVSGLYGLKLKKFANVIFK